MKLPAVDFPLNQFEESPLTYLPLPQFKASMSLWAIADVHISYKSNREAFQNLKPRPEDGLILAGDGMSSHEHHAQLLLTPVKQSAKP
jgi:hypothetical protein